MKKWICALLFVWSPAFANTQMSDMSDLWWNANESGWGVTVTHQREVIFLAFFVYGTDGKPTWYTGQASYQSQNSQSALVFTGQIFQTTGPWFGTAFNPNSVTVTQVGTMTFTAFLDSATLTYSINGVTVNKTLTRQTFRNNDLTGTYTGTIRQVQTGCSGGAINGTYLIPAVVTATHNTSGLVLLIQTNDDLCGYSGNYTQYGRLSGSTGQFVCASPSKGNYQMLELDATLTGITGRFTAQGNFCTSVTGRFSVVRN